MVLIPLPGNVLEVLGAVEAQIPVRLLPPEEFVEEADEADIAQGECWPTEAFELVEPVEVLLLLLFAWEEGEVGLFFQGWNPLPTAASAKGGGDLLLNLLHWAANIAKGVPLKLGWSYKEIRKEKLLKIWLYYRS